MDAVSIRLADIDLQLVVAPSEPAEQIFAAIEPGCRVSGLTMGQVSLIHLLRAILRQTGPADVVISAWTASMRDLDSRAIRLLRAAMADNPDGVERVFDPLESLLRELAPDSTTHKPGGKPGNGAGRWGG